MRVAHVAVGEEPGDRSDRHRRDLDPRGDRVRLLAAGICGFAIGRGHPHLGSSEYKLL
jgi:hypothetical protein